MGDGRDIGRNAADDVSRRQMTESSSAAVDEVFAQWQNLAADESQQNAFTENLAPYLPQLSVAFLSRTTADNSAQTYFNAIDADGSGTLELSELEAFRDNEAQGAERIFADFLIQHYSEFDASDGITHDGIRGDTVMTSEQGFFNNTDGTHTRLIDGVFETTHSDGTQLLVRENDGAQVNGSAASSVYVIPGPPETVMENWGGDVWTVTVDGVATSMTGMVEHTSDGIVLTHFDGSSVTYQADGRIFSRDYQGHITSVAQGNTVLESFTYGGDGQLREYSANGEHWWIDDRPLTGTRGIWYVDNSVDGVTQAANVSVDYDGNTTIQFADGSSKTVYLDGRIAWAQPDETVTNQANNEQVSVAGMSVTRDASGQIVEVTVPPYEEPFRRVQDGDGDPTNDRWVQGAGNGNEFAARIQFTENGTRYPDVVMSFAMDNGGTRQIALDGSGNITSITTSPDGGSFQRQVDGSYMYYPPGGGQPVAVTLSEVTGEPVFTILGEQDMTMVAFHRDGTMTSTRLDGDNVYTSDDSGQTRSVVHMEGRTVTRSEGYIEIANDDGTTTRYRDNHNGTWTMTTGFTDTAGNYTENSDPNNPVFVRAGWAADGTFILFSDADQDPNTFDPGDTYQRIESNGAITEQSINDGSISFTDSNGFTNTMDFTGGHISSLMQTTPDGQHQLTVEFQNGSITSIDLPDGSQIVPVNENGTVRWRHNGNPPYYLAEAPVIGANGQLMQGASNVWQMQDSSDPLFPGQMTMQILTEDGIEVLAMDGSYALTDGQHAAVYDQYGQMTEQVFGNMRDTDDDSVFMTYEGGRLTHVDLPDGRECRLENGVWMYQPDGIQLSQAPQVDAATGTVTLNFAQPQGNEIGVRIGEAPFFQTLLAEGVVQTSSADGQVDRQTYPSGVVVETTNGQTSGVSLPNGSYYEVIPNSGNPPQWHYTHDGITEVVQGNISYAADSQALVVDNGDEETTFQLDGGSVVTIQHRQGSLTTLTSLDGDQITSVTLTDNNNPNGTIVLRADQVDGQTVWHLVRNGIDTPLSRSTSVTLDENGGIVFHNESGNPADVPISFADGQWQIPLPATEVFPSYANDGSGQLTTVALPDGQGTWSFVSPGVWQFVGADGSTVQRQGDLTVANGVVTLTTAQGVETYSYTGENGSLQSVSVRDVGGNVTTIIYEANGEVTGVALPANGSMQFHGDFWTVTVGSNTVNVLGEPEIVNGQLVIRYGDTTTSVVDAVSGEMQFRTVDGVVSFDRAGVMQATDAQTMASRLAADSSWLGGVAGADGVLTRDDLQTALDNSTLTSDQRELALYLIQNFDRLHPVFDQQAGTLTLLSDTGVQIYGPNPGDVSSLSSQELVLLVNPATPAPSLWTSIALGGVLTREGLDSIVSSGTINGHTLTPQERAAAMYIQAHWSEFAGAQGEDMIVAEEIQAASLLSYARTHGINFPETAPVDEAAGDASAESAPIEGDPVAVTTIDVSAGDTNADVVSQVPTITYDAVDWLNQHQLVMRQYMAVDANGRRTGEIEEARVNAQITALSSRTDLTQDEQNLLNSLVSMQDFIANSPPPHMAEDFFRSVLLPEGTTDNTSGARVLGPNDTIYSMARTYLVEQWCREHGYSEDDVANAVALDAQGGFVDADLTRYISNNIQGEIDFIFEANHIVGNNVAVGQLLILDPAMVSHNNDAVYLAPDSTTLAGFTEISSEGQSAHVRHMQNLSTGEEAYILENGITLTRSTTGAWGAYDESGHFLGLVEGNAVNPDLIESGNFTLQLESNGDVPVQSISVTDEMTTVVFENNSYEHVYNNGVEVYFSPTSQIDQVVVPAPTGNVTYTRLVANGVTTGYQAVYPNGTVERVANAPQPGTDGAITFIDSTSGQAVTLAADGTLNHSSIDFRPVDESSGEAA